jgi:hypothetical protein
MGNSMKRQGVERARFKLKKFAVRNSVDSDHSILEKFTRSNQFFWVILGMFKYAQNFSWTQRRYPENISHNTVRVAAHTLRVNDSSNCM